MKIYLATNQKKINPVEDALDSLYKRIKLEIYQANYFNLEEQIVPQIIGAIKTVDVVIADISSESPNIYYEIGIAHSFGKPVILVSQKDNFNRFSLISHRFYKYDTTSTGIKNLAFRLEKILTNQNELNELKPLESRRMALPFQEFIYANEPVRNILKLEGINRAVEFERWVYELLKEIPNIDVEQSARRQGGEYDFIIWNSTNDQELDGLGNPIPIEVKSTKIIENGLIRSLANKATLQGFRSFIIITTAEKSKSNERLIKSLKSHAGISILIIDINDLEKIQTTRDFFGAIKKSYRQYFLS